MQKFLKVLYVLLATFLTIIITLTLKGRLFHYDNGWDGIAAILGALMISAVIGLVGSIYSLKWISKSKIKASLLFVTVLILIVVGFNKFFPIKKDVKSYRIERLSEH